jgi:SET domain-containing protein
MRLLPAPIEVRASTIEGLGAFAARRIRKASRVIEYTGERISPAEADERYAGGPAAHPHVLLFAVDSRTVIDAAVGGNEARFINHSCEPNCEAVTHRRRIWIHSLRDIEAGEELTYDYNLTADDVEADQQATEYPCRCGAASCRGTMFRIANQRRRKKAPRHLR